MADSEQEPKSKKLRSPSYPGIDLATAIKRAETFYEHEKRNSAAFKIVVQNWGMSEKSSASMVAVAALKSFGLIVEVEGASDRRLQLSELALRIVLDKRDHSPERQEAIKRAALMPKLHQRLWDKYGVDLPSDGNLAHELVFEWRFNENAVRDFIRQYRGTILFAKLAASDTISGEGGDRKEESEKPKLEDAFIAVGDFVQWASQGVDQFKEPKRIRELSDDKQWAFVDGSNTGMPVSELTKSEHKPDPPAPSPFGVPPRPRTTVEAQRVTDAGIRQDLFSLTEGAITVQWPAAISAESFEDIAAWLPILERKIKRSVKAGADPETK